MICLNLSAALWFNGSYFSRYYILLFYSVKDKLRAKVCDLLENAALKLVKDKKNW